MRNLFHQPGRVLALVLLASTAAFSSVVQITVVQSVGPATTSPSDATYLSNAATALKNGLTTFGTPGTPGYYTVASNPVDADAIVTTTFPSWLGVASPAAPFNNERGNELYFGVSIVSSVPFTLSQVLFNSSLLASGGDLSNLCFNSGAIGLLGAVQVAHNSSGPACLGAAATLDATTTLIDHFYYAGISLVDPTVVTSPANLAAELALVAGTVGNLSYSLTTSDGTTTSRTSNFDLEASTVPEPATTALLTLGFGLMVGVRKKLFARRVR